MILLDDSNCLHGVTGIELSDYSIVRPGVWLALKIWFHDTGWGEEVGFYRVSRVTDIELFLQYKDPDGKLRDSPYPFLTYGVREWLIWTGDRARLTAWLRKS